MRRAVRAIGKLLRGIGIAVWRMLLAISVITNIVLLIIVAVLLLTIFDIKNNIASPLIQGLHSSFVGLKDATIDWTIPVRDQIPVRLNIPLQTETIVELTEPVPINVTAFIDILARPAQVSLNLPRGLKLPVKLDLNVAVDQPLDVALDVRAVIPLKDTQLRDPVDNLQLLFEPLAVGLDNLPNDFGETFDMVGQALAGNAPDLLAENDYSRSPWTGYSITAGANYTLVDIPFPALNVPCATGIVPLGGIPALDEQIRPEVYEAGGPRAVNEAARAAMDAQSVPNAFYNGGFSAFRLSALDGMAQVAVGIPCQPVGGAQVAPPDTTLPQPPDTAGNGSLTQPDDPGDLGILPTPTP